MMFATFGKPCLVRFLVGNMCFELLYFGKPWLVAFDAKEKQGSKACWSQLFDTNPHRQLEGMDVLARHVKRPDSSFQPCVAPNTVSLRHFGRVAIHATTSRSTLWSG